MTQQKITIQFPTGTAAEKFMWVVGQDPQFKQVKFLLSPSQRLERWRLNRLTHRPNEAPLNIKAFLYVVVTGAIGWLLLSQLTASFFLSVDQSIITLGVAIITLSGAFAALGLPARTFSTSKLRKVEAICDSSVEKSLVGLAENMKEEAI